MDAESQIVKVECARCGAVSNLFALAPGGGATMQGNIVSCACGTEFAVPDGYYAHNPNGTEPTFTPLS